MFRAPTAATKDGLPQLNLDIEPTIYLDQLSRYLNHLQELRRINEGDDTADSPGYSLNPVRIPVSVLPGKKTRKGYGAEITIIAMPYLGRDLLPATFRNLVINDLVDQLAYPMTRVINSENEMVAGYLDFLAQQHFEKDSDRYEYYDAGPSDAKDHQNPTSAEMPIGPQASKKQFQKLVDKYARDRGVKLDVKQAGESVRAETLSFAVPASRSRRARRPLLASQHLAIFDLHLLAHVGADAKPGLQKHPVNRCTTHLMDVRAFLQEELQAAYEFLSAPEHVALWGLAGPELASAVRRRDVDSVRQVRDAFLRRVNLPPEYRFWEGNTTTALAWAILVEWALLNQRLIQDIKETSSAKGCPIGPVEGLEFYGPNPCEEARLA